MADCRKKEEVVVPPITPPTVVVPPEVAVNPFIKEFSLNSDVKATISTIKFDNGDSQNQIVIVLPENFVGDEILPIIKLTDEAESISPKSGDKVFFEGKPAIEYTLTRKDGKTEKYFLYVQHSGEFKAELLTKEFIIDPFIPIKIQFQLSNVGTLFLSEIKGARMDVTLEISYMNGEKRLFTDINRGNNIITYELRDLKSGKVSFKLVSNRPIRRESMPLNILLNLGKSYVKNISKLYTDTLNLIDGVNFDSNKSYKIRLENDFTAKPLMEIPLEISDENILKLKQLNSIDVLSYRVNILEDDKSIKSQEVLVKQSNSNVNPFPSLFMRISDYKIFTEKWVFSFTNNFKFKQAETFYTFRENNFHADLNFVNIQTKNEYPLIGDPVYCCDGAFTFRKFNIPETIPIGSYEVYGLVKGVSFARFSQKIEIIK